MEIQIPYPEIDLIIALVGIDQSKISADNLANFVEKIKSNIPVDKKDLNARIAEENGISIDVLINSPNYALLHEQFAAKTIKNAVTSMVNDLEISEVQAWALLAHAQGLL